MSSPDQVPPTTDAPAGGTTAVLSTPDAPTAVAPVTARRGPSRRVAVGGSVLLVAAVAAAAVVWVTRDDAPPARTAAPSPSVSAPAVATALPVLALAGASADGTVPWDAPLVVSATQGTITAVTGLGPDGVSVAGTVGADGRWTSAGTLVPTATYTLVAQVRDTDGASTRLALTATTGAPAKTASTTLVPGDAAVVGVGQAISLRLPSPVTDKAARADIERHLTVATTPAVVGSWRWMSSTELRYRGADLWAAGTAITVTAALDHVQLTPGLWGTTRTSSFTVGDALTSVVDTQAHTMTVSENGVVVRVMKASMGKPQFATRNGTFVVLEKFADRVMDSATVNLPPGTPAYKTAVKDAVRITNSGTFTHGAPWSVASQGRANVSHGCINLSPVDAHWYFLKAKRGDVVTVVNSTTGPNLSDAGSQDWNMTFDQWKSGSALA